MKNFTEETAKQLVDSIDNLTYAVQDLTDSFNRTDDFNNWSYAESLASIANSLVKHNALIKKDQEKQW